MYQPQEKQQEHCSSTKAYANPNEPLANIYTPDKAHDILRNDGEPNAAWRQEIASRPYDTAKIYCQNDNTTRQHKHTHTKTSITEKRTNKQYSYRNNMHTAEQQRTTSIKDRHQRTSETVTQLRN